MICCQLLNNNCLRHFAEECELTGKNSLFCFKNECSFDTTIYPSTDRLRGCLVARGNPTHNHTSKLLIHKTGNNWKVNNTSIALVFDIHLNTFRLANPLFELEIKISLESSFRKKSRSLMFPMAELNFPSSTIDIQSCNKFRRMSRGILLTIMLNLFCHNKKNYEWNA